MFFFALYILYIYIYIYIDGIFFSAFSMILTFTKFAKNLSVKIVQIQEKDKERHIFIML
jgi:hypothetical protein